MITTVTAPELFEREGKQFTRQVLKRGTTTITLVRPVLTPEEYESRRLEIEKAAIEKLQASFGESVY